MKELRIDEEFQNKIPPLTDAEFEQLRENILEAGEVYEPLVTWNGIIVDGHNRWKVIKENPGIVWRSREMDFPDKWSAFDWMYKNQLGRRNLTEAQRMAIIGEMTIARMHRHGAEKGGRGNQHKKVVSGQNDALPNRGRTRDQIAKELGIGTRTVDRAVEYAHGIDAIRETDPETADAILTGRLTPKKVDVAAIGKAKEEDRSEMIARVSIGERVGKPTVEIKIDNAPVTYVIDDLTGEIILNTNDYMIKLRFLIDSHRDLVEKHKPDIKKCITENAILEIKKVMEEL